jgi:hypothetical protein
MRRLRPWLLPAAFGAFGLLASSGCSLLFDLDPLSAGTGGAAAGGGGQGGAGGAGGAGEGGGTGTAGGGAGALEFVDDELEGEFGAGTFDGTAWTGDRVALAAGVAAGEFRSRVFDAAAPVTWQSLAWLALAPYSKPLPDDRETEFGYDEDNIDMDDNRLLLHLDGEGTLQAGQTVLDASGRRNDFTVFASGNAVSTFTPGRFGAAVEDGPTTWLGAEVGPDSDFQFGLEDFTWALWVRTTEDCAGNKVHLGVEDSGTQTDTHLWLGCAPPSYSGCPLGAAGGRAGGYFTSAQGTGDGGGFCSAKVINDGVWHHLAVTKEGHLNATVRLYVDGVEEDVEAMSFTELFDFTGNPQLTVGAFSGGSYQAVGAFDEVAIWDSALEACRCAPAPTRRAPPAGPSPARGWTRRRCSWTRRRRTGLALRWRSPLCRRRSSSSTWCASRAMFPGGVPGWLRWR